MSDYEVKDGFGNLFTNNRKAKDSHPDYQGNARVNGELVEIAGWKKQGKNGVYLSLKFQAPRAKKQPEPADPNDDVPF